ncbi:MAG: phosphatidate cytidylyltransferase [Alphaproteobacteria bacterium]
MEKDNLQKYLKYPIIIYNFFLLIFNKIVSQVHYLDPSQNTRKRIISSLIMIPVALIAIFASQKLFIFLAILIAVLMAFEWSEMSRNMPNQNKWRTIGFFYITIPIYCAISLRILDDQIIFWMFSIIWATDIFAFFAGRSLGGPKIAPTISPNKTWSGLIGGVLASMMIGLISTFAFPGSWLFFLPVSVLISLVEQASDLTESKFKRIFGVKDSGTIIPGHGGVLDRLDGMIFVAPLVYFLTKIFPSQFGLV